MKTKLGLSVACGLAVLFTGMNAQAELNLGANVEINTDAVSNPGGFDGEAFNQGGRVQFTASGKHESDFGYVNGAGQLLLKDDGSTAVDDMYVGFGSGAWGVKMGRFEGVEVFSKGVDTIHNVIGNTNFYQGANARGRISDAGQILLHVKPSDKMHFELGTVYGVKDAVTGVRPGLAIDLTDDLRVAAAIEYLDTDTEVTVNGEDNVITVIPANSTVKGGGVYVRYATDAFALKMNVAKGEQETEATASTPSTKDWENTSYNINIESGQFGVGYTHSEDDVSGDDADTFYGRYFMPNLMGVKNAAGSLAFSAASADSVPEDEFAVRFRINYTF